jgi:hypothetical protein
MLEWRMEIEHEWSVRDERVTRYLETVKEMR